MYRIILLLLLGNIVSSISIVAQHDYPKALNLSTYFLGAQRSGDNNSWIHEASHTEDGSALSPQVDLTGGWHDCGDHIKFSFTNNWAATMYLLGYHFFPSGFLDNYSSAFSAPPSNGIPDILDEVKIQTDFIIKSFNNGNVVQQVGSGDYDHSGSFAEPATQSTLPTNKGGDPRPIYINSNCVNIIGGAASALALMYMNYSDYDQTYANECLASAKEFYALGKQKSGSCGSVDCSSGGNPCYNLSSTSSDDEMAMAAACLYESTGEISYRTDAENYFNSNLWDGQVHYYGGMDLIAAAVLYRTTADIKYLDFLKKHFTFHSKAQYNAMGFYNYQYSSGWGNLQYTGNEAFIASLIHSLDGRINSTYYDFAKSNTDFILGSHDELGNIPASYSFLIGYDELGGGYPLRPHHKAAFGSTKTDWSLFTLESNSPGSVAYAFELKGAVVGGPDDSGNYTDKIDVFQNSEVCTYYNAGFTGALAYINMIENNLIAQVKELSGQPELVQNGRFMTIKQGGQMQVVDAVGKLVIDQKVNKNQTINLSDLKVGVYFVKLNGLSHATRIVIK